MDFFLDTTPVRAITRLADALAESDAGRVREALVNLDRGHPGHRQREKERKPIGVVELPAPADTDDGYDRLKMMGREWMPAASELLGDLARDFLKQLCPRPAGVA